MWHPETAPFSRHCGELLRRSNRLALYAETNCFAEPVIRAALCADPLARNTYSALFFASSFFGQAPTAIATFSSHDCGRVCRNAAIAPAGRS